MYIIPLITLVTSTMISSTIVKSPPECATATLNHSMVLCCSTDLVRPVAWRYKAPENDDAQYLYLFGRLKPYASSLGISGINITRISNTTQGQYDLMFDKIKVESACEYQCQDNDGMDYGPVVDLIVLRDPISCTATEIEDENNKTIALNLTCSLQYRHKSDRDAFVWYNNKGQLKICKNTLSVDGQWNTVVSSCISDSAVSHDYTDSVISHDYTFIASFRKPASPKFTEESCVKTWSYTGNTIKGSDLLLANTSGMESFSLLIMCIGAAVAACVIIVSCIVLTVRHYRNRPRSIKVNSFIEPYEVLARGDTCEYDEYSVISDEQKSEDASYTSLVPESFYTRLTTGDYEKARPLNYIAENYSRI